MTASQTILREVAQDFDLPIAALRGGSKQRTKKTRSTARHIAMWLHRFTIQPRPSFPEIADAMGFDHCSVMNGINRISGEINQGTMIGTRTLALALRLVEIDNVRFGAPDTSAEVLQKGDEKYRNRILREKVRRAVNG